MENRDYTAPAIVTGIIAYITIMWSASQTIKLIDIISPIATLLAALVGAEAAFRLQKSKINREELIRRKSAVNQATHLITAMYSNMRQYRNEVIVPAESSPVPWLHLQGLLAYHYEVNLPREGLLFLFEGEGDCAQVYAELMIEDQRYNLAIGMIKQLHNTICEKLKPELERLGVYPGNVDLALLLSNLPQGLQIDLNSLTFATFKTVRENIESVKEIYEKFSTTINTHFPEIKIPKVIFQD